MEKGKGSGRGRRRVFQLVSKDLGRGARAGKGRPHRENDEQELEAEGRTVLQTCEPTSLAAQEVWKRREESAGPGGSGPASRNAG